MKTKEEYNEAIKKLEAERDALPSYELKVGDLCEFWDSEIPPRYPDIAPLYQIEENGFSMMDREGCSGSLWNHARKLETKATRIEWRGEGESPTWEHEILVVEYSDGMKSIHHPSANDWKSRDNVIVAYWRLEQ